MANLTGEHREIFVKPRSNKTFHKGGQTAVISVFACKWGERVNLNWETLEHFYQTTRKQEVPQGRRSKIEIKGVKGSDLATLCLCTHFVNESSQETMKESALGIFDNKRGIRNRFVKLLFAIWRCFRMLCSGSCFMWNKILQWLTSLLNNRQLKQIVARG